MKTKGFTVHVNAYCFDCDGEWQDYNKARRQAYNHAKTTGHKVTCEIGRTIQYN